MKRIKGILLRWNKEKEKDTDENRVSPLTYLVDLEYDNYIKICFWCHEKPLSRIEWFKQEIELSED